MSPTAPVLRRMRWWDVEAAAALERELFPGDAWTAEGFWSELAGASRHYVAAVGPADELLGYAGVVAPRAGDADIATLAVRSSEQRRGIGTMLLLDLLLHARERGCAAVLLEVRADEPVAQRLYARHGFTRIGVRRGYYDGGRVDALVLRRRGPG